MLGLLPFVLAATAATPPAPASTSPWWEKFVYTMSDDGAQQACKYQSSDAIVPAEGCGDDSEATAGPSERGGTVGLYTKITVERRFTPANQPDPVRLPTGDTLLGGQVLALAIDSRGAVRSCKVVGESGEMAPPYSCDDARAERFKASAGTAPADVRHGFMTVLIYGHEEYLA